MIKNFIVFERCRTLNLCKNFRQSTGCNRGKLDFQTSHIILLVRKVKIGGEHLVQILFSGALPALRLHKAFRIVCLDLSKK